MRGRSSVSGMGGIRRAAAHRPRLLFSIGALWSLPCRREAERQERLARAAAYQEAAWVRGEEGEEDGDSEEVRASPRVARVVHSRPHRQAVFACRLHVAADSCVSVRTHLSPPAWACASLVACCKRKLFGPLGPGLPFPTHECLTTWEAKEASLRRRCQLLLCARSVSAALSWAAVPTCCRTWLPRTSWCGTAWPARSTSRARPRWTTTSDPGSTCCRWMG